MNVCRLSLIYEVLRTTLTELTTSSSDRVDNDSTTELPSTLSPESCSSPLGYETLNPSSDAPEVPVSSSPGVCSSPLVSSQSSVVSVECGYSVSDTDSCETTESRTPKVINVAQGRNEFAEQLTDRLLCVAGSQLPHGADNSAGYSRDLTPRAFRIVKRSYSRSLSPESSPYSSKLRKVDRDHNYVSIK
jgi:hypothetical protein